jgi:hypothetical protein
MEEVHRDVLKQRSIDLGHEDLHVFAGPLECKVSESGKKGA